MKMLFLLTLVIAAGLVGAAVAYTVLVYRREHRREQRRIARLHRSHQSP